MSDDELLGAVLSSGKEYSMENNRKTSSKKRKLAPAIAVVAAAAAMATTAGAVSIYYRNINEEYNNALIQDATVFPQDYTDKDGNLLDMKDKAEAIGIYEKLNVEINKTFECEGFTFEVPGAISDGEELLIIYNVIFNEDPWSGENPWFDEGENIFLEGTTDCDEVSWSNRAGLGTKSKRDGKAVYSGYLALAGIENCTADTLKVSFDSLWGSRTCYGDEYHFNAEVEIPITEDFKKFSKIVDIPDAPYVKLARWGNWDLAQIEVTPLKATFILKTDGKIPDPLVCKFYSPDIPAYMTFNDDTTLDLTLKYNIRAGIDKGDKTLVVEVLFNYPVDVDEIQSIQFASALVDMDGSTATVDIPDIPVEEDWRLDPTPQK